MTAAVATGVSEQGGVARLRMMCSHGGRFLPCGPDGAIRYVGGETRVLVVPREISFRELAAKLGEMEVGKIVSAVRYRLADDDGVLVSVTCDEELAHMRDDYDRLKTTRPSAIFRVLFSGRAPSGRPPLPPKMRRVQSEPALAAPARTRVLRCAAPAPMRRVQSAQEFARCSRFQPIFYDRRRQCYYAYKLQPDQYAPVPVPAPPMRPPPSMSKNAQGARQEPVPVAAMSKNALVAGKEPAPVAAMSKNSHGASAEGQEPAAVMSSAKGTVEAAELGRRAFWEFE